MINAALASIQQNDTGKVYFWGVFLVGLFCIDKGMSFQ